MVSLTFALLYPLGKTSLPIGEEAEWVADLVWGFQKRGKCLAPTGSRTTIHRLFQQTAPTTPLRFTRNHSVRIASVECALCLEVVNPVPWALLGEPDRGSAYK